MKNNQNNLQILLLEDNAVDALLIERELKAARFSFHLRLVHTEAELRRELAGTPPDLVLSDHGLPSFDGFAALEIVRAQSAAVPFIFVSGSNHQGMVAEMFDRGATDYVFKNDLHDLGPAVLRALEPPVEELPEPVAAPEPVQIPAPPKPVAEFMRLLLCPACLRARDESGVVVDVAECFRAHQEVVVLHYRCEDCGRLPASG